MLSTLFYITRTLAVNSASQLRCSLTQTLSLQRSVAAGRIHRRQRSSEREREREREREKPQGGPKKSIEKHARQLPRASWSAASERERAEGRRRATCASPPFSLLYSYADAWSLLVFGNRAAETPDTRGRGSPSGFPGRTTLKTEVRERSTGRDDVSEM